MNEGIMHVTDQILKQRAGRVGLDEIRWNLMVGSAPGRSVYATI